MIHAREWGGTRMSYDIDKILKERNKLLKRIDDIDRFLIAYEEFMGTNVDRNDVPETQIELPILSYAQTERGKNHRRSLVPEEIANLAEAMIREKGKPMKRGEIATEIEAQGFTLKSKDKNRYVGTILWRHFDKFDNIEGLGYWVRDLGPPAVKPDWIDQLAVMKEMMNRTDD